MFPEAIARKKVEPVVQPKSYSSSSSSSKTVCLLLEDEEEEEEEDEDEQENHSVVPIDIFCRSKDSKRTK